MVLASRTEQVVVVQPVHDAISAHRNAGQSAEQSADAIVEGAIGEQPIVCRIVQEYE